jgi:hypothetical protein
VAALITVLKMEAIRSSETSTRTNIVTSQKIARSKNVQFQQRFPGFARILPPHMWATHSQSPVECRLKGGQLQRTTIDRYCAREIIEMWGDKSEWQTGYNRQYRDWCVLRPGTGVWKLLSDYRQVE